MRAVKLWSNRRSNGFRIWWSAFMSGSPKGVSCPCIFVVRCTSFLSRPSAWSTRAAGNLFMRALPVASITYSCSPILSNDQLRNCASHRFRTPACRMKHRLRAWTPATLRRLEMWTRRYRTRPPRMPRSRRRAACSAVSSDRPRAR